MVLSHLGGTIAVAASAWMLIPTLQALAERSSPLRETFPSVSLVIIKHLICSNMYSFVKHKLCVTQLL